MAEPTSPEKKELPQPENQVAWASATKGLLGNARSITDELFAALKDKDVVKSLAPAELAKPYKNQGPKVKADLDAKLAVTRFAVNTVDTAIQRTSQSIIRLGHEQQRKWAPLKVCEWRLGIRARRPTRELFRDHVEDALDKEKESLLDARVKLTALAQEGKLILEDCEANKARLTRNVRAMVMLGNTKLPPLVDDSDLPPSPSSPSGPIPDGTTVEGEEVAQAKPRPVVPLDPEGLLKRAPQLEEIVLKYVKKGEDMIKKHKDRCDKAKDQVWICLQKRWGENDTVKKDLELHIQEMEVAIVAAEKALARMKKRIDHYAEVELQPKFDTAEACLAKLRESKASLEDDFHHKLVAMKIDECCRKITPEKTGVPPESVPVAALLEGSKEKKKKVTRTNSSPAIVGVDFTNQPSVDRDNTGRPCVRVDSDIQPERVKRTSTGRPE